LKRFFGGTGQRQEERLCGDLRHHPACPNRVILPPLLRTLEFAGIDRRRITILIATGTHRPNVGQELVSLVGEDIAEAYPVVNHDCRNRDAHRRIGELEARPSRSIPSISMLT